MPEHNGHLDLVVLMMQLGKQQINSIWVEAGPTLAGALLQAGLVDELIVYVAPKLLGSDARGLCVLPCLEKLADAPHFKFNEIRRGPGRLPAFNDCVRLSDLEEAAHRIL